MPTTAEPPSGHLGERDDLLDLLDALDRQRVALSAEEEHDDLVDARRTRRLGSSSAASRCRPRRLIVVPHCANRRTRSSSSGLTRPSRDLREPRRDHRAHAGRLRRRLDLARACRPCAMTARTGSVNGSTSKMPVAPGEPVLPQFGQPVPRRVVMPGVGARDRVGERAALLDRAVRAVRAHHALPDAERERARRARPARRPGRACGARRRRCRPPAKVAITSLPRPAASMARCTSSTVCSASMRDDVGVLPHAGREVATPRRPAEPGFTSTCATAGISYSIERSTEYTVLPDLRGVLQQRVVGRRATAGDRCRTRAACPRPRSTIACSARALGLGHAELGEVARLRAATARAR